MRADRLVAANVSTLLNARGQNQKDLAMWCRHTETGISSILRGDRHFRVTDYDRVADFFGIAVYQLFQPGISPLTERRKGKDRRNGQDRRISASHRAMLEVKESIEAARPRRRTEPPMAANDEKRQRRGD